MNNWIEHKNFSDLFLPEIKSILGQNFIGEIKEEDCFHNTDLIVLKMEVIRFACRVRRFEYFDKFHNEFTFRSKLPSGNKTELNKIIEGWGDFFFYGFADYYNEKLHHWIIADLKVFRSWFSDCLARKNYKWAKKENKDNSSSFLVFNLNDLPKNFILHSSNKSELWPRKQTQLSTASALTI